MDQLRLVSVGVIKEGGSSKMTAMVKEKAVSVCSLVTEIGSLCGTILLLSLFPLGNSTHNGAAFHLLGMGSDHS